jgi:predicted ATPase
MPMLDRIELQPGPDYRPDAWYFDIPAIGQLRRSGLDLTPATVIVGENGSGKSTLLEALAQAWRGYALTGAQVQHWQAFLTGPQRYLRYLVDDRQANA